MCWRHFLLIIIFLGTLNSDPIIQPEAVIFTFDKFTTPYDLSHSLTASSSLNNYSNILTIKFLSGNFSRALIGKSLDYFIGPRPWWIIKTEPSYRDDSPSENSVEAVLLRFNPRWDEILSQISHSQYPTNCGERTLFVGITEGLDSIGNNFYNYRNNAARNIWGIFTPYIVDPNTKSTSFLDENYCPAVLNKFHCAFIPPTNCTMPEELNKCGKLRSKCPGPLFSNSTSTGVPITDAMSWEVAAYMKSKHTDPEGPQIEGIRYFGLFSKDGLRTSKISFTPRNHLMAYAFLFRLNYDFRSRIAHEIEKWKASLNPPFPSDGDCVAAHIRRSDRHLKGVNMREWCEVHKIYPNGSCWDDHTNTTRKHNTCSHYYNMGCHTAFPFGAMTVSHFLNVSRDVFKKKNVYIMTDDGHAVEEELKQINDNSFTVYQFTAPPSHRKNSLANGVNYLAGIMIARECTALIGHHGSAVTALLVNLLCVHHYNKFGYCPPFFDFSM